MLQAIGRQGDREQIGAEYCALGRCDRFGKGDAPLLFRIYAVRRKLLCADCRRWLGFTSIFSKEGNGASFPEYWRSAQDRATGGNIAKAFALVCAKTRSAVGTIG